MSGTDELLTIAEIAVTLAGFAGVVAAFLHRGSLHPVDRLRFVNMFVIAFSALTLSFLPLAFVHLGLAERKVWALSSAGMIALWCAHMALVPFLRGRLQAGLAGTDLRSPFLLMVVPAIVNLLVQLANATGWLFEPGFVPYFFGLFVYLYAAGLGFVYAVIFRPEDGEGSGEDA